MEKSPHLQAFAVFADRLELLPHADERVTIFERHGDRINVAYEGRTATRVMLINKVAGEWTVMTKLSVPLEVVPPPAPAKFDHKPFHFTEWKSCRATFPERKKGIKKHRRVSVVKILIKGGRR